MRFGSSRSQLYDAQQSASARWDAVSETWGDATQREFEEKIRAPMEEHVSNLIRAIDQLSTLFAQMRNECEFPT